MKKIPAKMWIISFITREMLIKLILQYHHMLSRVIEMITESVGKTIEHLELPFHCFLKSLNFTILLISLEYTRQEVYNLDVSLSFGILFFLEMWNVLPLNLQTFLLCLTTAGITDTCHCGWQSKTTFLKKKILQSRLNLNVSSHFNSQESKHSK